MCNDSNCSAGRSSLALLWRKRRRRRIRNCVICVFLRLRVKLLVCFVVV